MLVIYPFSTKDDQQALKNAQWIAEVDEYKSHDLFILADRRCEVPLVQKITEILTPVFKLVQSRWTLSDIDGWPEGANMMFCLAATLIQHEKTWPYYLWLEPDAIPIRKGWLEELNMEYLERGKPFMGEKVDLGTARPDVPVHMSGVGFYQNPLYMLAGEAYRAHEVAWDIAAKDQIIPHAHWTKRIQHYWKHGTFTSLDGIRPETVLFHSSKDGSLIDLLRQKAAPETNQHSVPTEPTTGETGDVTRRPSTAGLYPPGAASPAPSREEIGTRAVQPSIKILPHNGIWVLEGDTIISDMVEREGRLDFDSLIPNVISCIRPGDTVVDVGAFIGDHTVAYSNAVGPSGKVIAYEPNTLAFQCLVHNTDKMGNVFTFCHALGAQREVVELTDLPNAASNYIGAGGRHVHVRPLDEDASLFGQLNLIKIDVEGYELNVLKGAEKLIEKFHPIMVVEINEIALARQNTTKEDVISWIVRHGYLVSILHQHKDAPFFDILATPEHPPEISSGVGLAHTESLAVTPPVGALTAETYTPTIKEEVEWHIGVLKQFCESAPQTKAIVMQKLVYAGLRLPNKKKKHAPTKTHKQTNGQRRPTVEECQT